MNETIEERTKRQEKVISYLLKLVIESYNEIDRLNNVLEDIEKYINEKLYMIDTETYEKKYFNSGKDIMQILEDANKDGDKNVRHLG